ncbi:MAG: class II aldolase/adducin family protein [Firmicutes bacterium]|nr:class II aldolase/adducin family protein [Bacillota bacterium]
MAKIKAFLDDTAQIIGPSFDFEQEVTGRSEREEKIARFVLDKAKLVYEEGKKIGGVKPLGAFRANLEHYIYVKKYSKNTEGSEKERIAAALESIKMPADATAREIALRDALVEYGNRLVSEDLVQGTWGNLSARLDEKTILVTPSGIDYASLRPADMVRVDIETLAYDEAGLKPTSERGLHAMIYAARPEIGAIIHTHSTYCSVFAAAEKDLHLTGDAAAEKDSHLLGEAAAVFGNTVRLAKYGFAGSKKLANNTAQAVGDGMGALMSHHGMIVCGTDVAAAFQNACLLEKAARDALASQ